MVLASRVAGIAPPLDGVTATLCNPERLAEDVERAVRFGFGEKPCVHPEQVRLVNEGFAITEEQIGWAKWVLEVAEAGKSGAVRVDGEMVDYPVIKRARATMESAGI